MARSRAKALRLTSVVWFMRVAGSWVSVKAKASANMASETILISTITVVGKITCAKVMEN